VFGHLQIFDRRERLLVGTADLALRLLAPLIRLGRGAPARPPRRILLLRIERIGDLLMSLEAIEDVRQAAPAAQIDLAVGSWNAALARRMPGLHAVEILDAAWLARDGQGLALPSLLRRARSWAGRAYDLAINFEPDIRSNLVLTATGARRTAGFTTGGGGPLLDVALAYEPRSHTAENARRLVAAVLDVPPRPAPARLQVSTEDRRRASEKTGARAGPLIGIHASGGRAIKQWDVDRFAALALRLVTVHGATIVLTGSDSDRPLVEPIAKILPPDNVVDLAGSIDLPLLAAVLERLDVFVTGDTGPMHVAAAVGTPVVGVFGPSDPARYAPRDPIHQIVRVDLPCSPCNRIRQPPERCVGHTPDCLTGIDVEMVYRAVEKALGRSQLTRMPSGAARGSRR
jgi:lipopolysaccharide heptosyltransferase II